MKPDQSGIPNIKQRSLANDGTGMFANNVIFSGTVCQISNKTIIQHVVGLYTLPRPRRGFSSRTRLILRMPVETGAMTRR
jgi:hypothetical protein